PFSRKDMEIYGTTGYIVANDRNKLSQRYHENQADTVSILPERPKPFHDPFEFFRALIRKEIKMDNNDLSALPLNMVVMEILEAAKISARERRTIEIKDFLKTH
ncbi:MAG: Gfo/Idh/MocA family protein, partial [Flavisolibacter sp.]